jgi:hypothetical protein
VKGFGFAYPSLFGLLLGDSKGNDRDDDKNHRQNNGKLEKSFLDSTPGAIYTVRLAEYTTHSATLHLEHNGQDENYGKNYLRDTQVSIQLITSSSFFFINSLTS